MKILQIAFKRHIHRKKNALFVLLPCFFLACTDTNITNTHIVNLDLVMKKDDSIHLYYTTDGTINFNETYSFWTKVKGSNKNQSVNLKVPSDVIPKQIRLDFGNNRSQEDIILNSVKVQYHKKTFAAKGKEIYNYFRVDDSNTVLDKDLGILRRKNPEQLTGPSLYPNGDFLRKKLEELQSKK